MQNVKFHTIKKQSAKEIITSILSEKWPLSLKEIYYKSKHNYGSNLTYQAIHKKIKEMLEFGNIEKINNKYQLSIDWIQNEKEYYTRMENHYQKKDDLFIGIENKDYVNHSFQKPLEIAKFAIDFATEIPNTNNKVSIFHWWFMYPTFSLSDSEYLRMVNATKINKIYMVCNNKSVIDKSVSEEYKKFGIKVKLGVKLPINPDVMVRGDYVSFIYFPEEFKKQWLKYCQASGILKKIQFGKLLPLLYLSRGKYNVVVTKNPELADTLREQTLKYFK